jgi:uncharacterized membrane protein
VKAVLLSVHVLAAIILIGPITVAASVFPRYARSAAAANNPSTAPALAVAAAMHRISRTYAVPAIAVPVFGIGLAAAMHALGQAWLMVSMGLTAAAAALLVFVILPSQSGTLEHLRERSQATPGSTDRALRIIGMQTGAFATLWAVVVVLMITRPGSSTGV